MRLVLAPWEWDSSDPGWRKPGNDYTGGCLDLRTLTEAGSVGPTASGLGLFAYEDLPPGIQVAADLGDDPLARMKVPERNALADALGLDRSSLSDAPLAQILAEQVLGSLADPSGAARTKPLRMNRRGTELYLKGFGRIYQHPLDKAHPVYDQTLAVRRLDYDRNRALLLDRLPRPEALAVLQRWTGWDMRALDATEDELLPQQHLSDGSRPPSTTLTESWPTNSTNIGSGQDQPWNEDGGDGGVHVGTGKLRKDGFFGLSWGRCTSDLSSDDHSHEALCAMANTNNQIGPCVRKVDSTVQSFFVFRLYGFGPEVRMSKYVTGTLTTLDSDGVDPGTAEQRTYLEADGSTIYGERGPEGAPGSTLGPSTDTDLTGNLQCGYFFGGNDQSDCTLDDHTMQDLATAFTASLTDELGLNDALAVQQQFDPALFDAVGLVDTVREIPWDETFESAGYDEPWSGGETVDGTATLDEDADVPAAAPPWWGSKALRAQVGDSEDAYVSEPDIGASAADTWVTWEAYLNAQNIGASSTRVLAELTTEAGTSERIITIYIFTDGAGTARLQCNVYDDGVGFAHNTGTWEVGTFADIEFRWNQIRDAYELWRDGELVDNGSITQAPADNDYRIRRIHQFGIVTGPGTADIYFGRFTVGPHRANFLPAAFGQLIITSFNDIKG